METANLGADSPPGESAETQPAGPVSAEPQPELLPADSSNDAASENQTAPATSIIEKMRRTVGAVFERNGILYKRNPHGGRVKRDEFGNPIPGKGDVAIGPAGEGAPVAPARVVPAVAPVSPVPDSAGDKLFRRSLVAAARGVIGFLKQLVRIKADAAGIDKDFTETTLRDAQPDKEALEDFTDALKLCLDKWGIQSQNAPEYALAINAGRLIGPYVMLFRTFDEEIKRRRAAELKGGAK